MLDEIKDNPKLLVIVLVTGLVAVSIFAIFLLVSIWLPNNTSESVGNDSVSQQNTTKFGSYNRIYVDEKTLVEKYCNNILNTFASNDLGLINNIILPEYLEFRGTNKDGLKSVLTQKGVLGKLLQFSSYKVVDHPRYGKIFEVNIQSYDNTYSDKMLIMQKSPNDYKVSFDGFIGLNKDVKSVTIDGLKLDITEIKEFTTLTSIKFTLTNISGHNIIINKENNYENVYLQLTTGTEIRMNSTWLSGETKELTNGYEVNLNTEFVTSGISSGVARNIVIKDIYDTLSRETKDIVFPIN